jgi:hypothetical protein
MKNHEAQGLFKESELLYRERRYEEALEVLRRLDEKYPNTRNILYPIAKCYRRLGRFEETVAICDRLILEFDDERARHMRRQANHAIQRSNAQTIQVAVDVQAQIDDEIDAGFDALDLGDLPPLDEEAPTVHIPGGYAVNRTQESGPPWLYIGIGAAVIVVLLVIVIAAMSGGGADSGVEPVVSAETEEVDVVQFFVNLIAFSVATTLISYWISLYSTLRIMDKLPYGTFSDDALIVFGYSLLGVLLNFTTLCIGLIINIVILRKRFELTFIDFLIIFGINFALSIPIGTVSSFLFTETMNEIVATMESAAQTDIQ